MDKKLTKKELYAKAIAKVGDDKELKAFFEHEIALLEKRAVSKANPEDEAYKDLILDVLASSDKPLTITEIMKADSNLPQSNQKLTHLVRKLKECELVTRVEVKGRAYFSLAETNEEEA